MKRRHVYPFGSIDALLGRFLLGANPAAHCVSRSPRRSKADADTIVIGNMLQTKDFKEKLSQIIEAVKVSL
jgi:hypothetical protein